MPTTIKYKQKTTKIGTVIAFSGDTMPNNWVFADGATLQIADYPVLFATIGNTYGGDGITTFQLPDYRGRVPVGKDDMGGTAANVMTSGKSGIDGTVLGDTGGSQTHTLSTAQMPLHGHAFFSTLSTTTQYGTNTYEGGLMRGDQTTRNTYTHDGTVSEARDEQIGGSGSSSPHQNTQPSIICNYIIKVA